MPADEVRDGSESRKAPVVESTLNWKPATWMVASSLGFAAMSACTRVLGDRCDWSAIAFTRAFFMFIVAALMVWKAGVPVTIWKPRTLWIRSLAGSFALTCNFYALTMMPSADVLTLTNTSPLWIAICSWVWMRLRPSWSDVLGVALGILGVTLIQQPHFRDSGWAPLVALISSFSTTVALLGLHKLKGTDPRLIVTHFAAIASAAAGLFMVCRWETVQAGHFNLKTWLLLAGVCATGTFAQFLITKAYAAGSPTRLSVLGLAQVLFALIFDWWIWNRSLDLATSLGFALVLAPTAWIMTHARLKRDEEIDPETEAAATVSE